MSTKPGKLAAPPSPDCKNRTELQASWVAYTWIACKALVESRHEVRVRRSLCFPLL